jgi:hypothetical protein
MALSEIPSPSASRDPVPVVGVVKDALAKHLKLNSGDGYIFHAETDSQLHIVFENIIRSHVIPTLAASGVEWHGMHAFRRGLATVLHSIDSVGKPHNRSRLTPRKQER